MMCANCWQKMSSENWLLVSEIQQDTVLMKQRFCSVKCMVGWYV